MTFISQDCSDAREAISARLDGELSTPDEHALDAHLSDCDACRSHEARAWDLRRALTMQSVDTRDARSDDDERALARVARPDVATDSFMRWLLFVIGATLLVVNTSGLMTSGNELDAHLTRHDSVFGAALGIGMLAVAARPHRAIGLVPLTSAIALMMAVVAVFDLVNGRATILAEARHLLEFAGLLCLWFISGGPLRLQRRVRPLVASMRRSTVPEWPSV